MLSLSAFAQDTITGFWRIADRDGTPQGIVQIYEYGGLLYGRMIATYDDAGRQIRDTIDTRIDKEDRLKGTPPLCGLDFVYGLKHSGNEWQGFIVDPDTGDEYVCRIWMEGENLMVRGQLKGWLGFLGGTQTWSPFDPRQLESYVKPDELSGFVPVIPVKK